MPLERAPGPLYVTADFDIAFPMQDTETKTFVSCSITSEALQDVFEASWEDELDDFATNRSEIEERASFEYDHNRSVHLTTLSFAKRE